MKHYTERTAAPSRWARGLPISLRQFLGPKHRPGALSWMVKAAVATGVVAACVASVPAQQAVPPHAYFESLVSRADHWRSFSLRSAAQLARPKDGGYANSNSGPLAVTYSPQTDPEPNKQDAAKVVIPPFQEEPVTKLASAVTSTALTLPMSDLGGDVTKVTTSFNAKGRQIKIGNEIIIIDTNVTPLDRSTGFVTVSQRGAYGTTAAAHSAGALVALGGNSLANQVRVPVDSHDGATWFFTWDAYFTDSYLDNGIGNFKAFQLSSDESIWLEPQTHFDGGSPRPAGYDPLAHVAVTGRIRSYNKLAGGAMYAANDENKVGYLGPGVTNNNPIQPNSSEFFLLHPNRWTRWWIRIEQRANDYDIMDAWMADEQNDAVQVYSAIPVSVRTRNGVDSINSFYVEFNTSTGVLAPGRTKDFRDLVAYVRNIAILRNPPADVSALLVRPGATQAVPRPSPPQNLKILTVGP